MRILTRRKLFSFAVFLTGGILAARLLHPNLYAMLVCAGALLFAALMLHMRRAERRYFAGAATILFFLSVAFAGAGYYIARADARPRFESAYSAPFSGRISGSPYLDEGGARFVCKLTDAAVDGKALDYDLRLYLRGGEDALAQIECGQRVEGIGHLYAPEEVTNPHAFDFGEYLWRAGMAGYVTAKTDDVRISGTGGGIENALLRARKAIAGRIYTAFPKNAELVIALILGDTRDMDDDIREDFSQSGVAHLLAVSGMHVTLIAVALSFLLGRLFGVRVASILSLGAILVYAAIVGFRPSVTRAVIMYAVLCAAPMVGRTSDGSTRLGFALAIILVINPLDIADVGLVLSFLASAGLMWLAPPLKRLLRADRLAESRTVKGRIAHYIASLAIATTAAQIATFPALALYYASMPTYSVFANILLVPYSTLGMYFALIGIAFPPLAFIPDAMFTSFTAIVTFFAHLPYGAIPVRPPPVWIWLAFFASGVAVSELGGMREKFKPYASLMLPALVALACFWTFDSGCLIVFLDVGQADAAIVRAEGRTYVIDVGEDGSQVIDHVTGEGWRIDALFLSHPHADHAGGLLELAEACDIGVVYVPAGWHASAENKDILRESEEIARMGIEIAELSPGDEVAISARSSFYIIDALPRSDDAINDMSLIMLLDYGESEALFTGDANITFAPDIDVLKVAHHGARDSTGEAIIDLLTPEVAVISVGRNSYGHPSADVIGIIEDAGGAVYRTDECGAVSVRMEYDGAIHVETFRKGCGD
ncbi:MAG: ComEC/Rec2 family competence protein [Christensenellales bacterium]|jgi:competence protein ComEC